MMTYYLCVQGDTHSPTLAFGENAFVEENPCACMK